MRRINKDPQDISDFDAWVRNAGLSNDWCAYSSPKSPHHPHYVATRDHIATTEQQSLSAYTEKPLGNTTHIDHFRKRSLFPLLTFDYSNLLVDDLNDNYGACFKDNHAGVTQATFDGDNRILSPVTDNMPDFIDFTVKGKMIPKPDLTPRDRSRVEETIRVFNLNHATLQSCRQSIINAVADYRTAELTAQEIMELLSPSGFHSAIEWALTN